MTVYVDSSIILRHLLKQPGHLLEWRLIRSPISSRLTEVECIRTLDRLRVAGEYDDSALAGLRNSLYKVLTAFEVIEVTRSLLRRAAEPSPTALGTLDAVHLSSAIAARERIGRNVALATHDAAFALAARASGFRVLGI